MLTIEDIQAMMPDDETILEAMQDRFDSQVPELTKGIEEEAAARRKDITWTFHGPNPDLYVDALLKIASEYFKGCMVTTFVRNECLRLNVDWS